MFSGLTLIAPGKKEIEEDAVCAEWQRHDGSVLRLGRSWGPPALGATSVRLYGADTFCLALAQKLGVDLCSPEDILAFTWHDAGSLDLIQVPDRKKLLKRPAV